MGNYSITDLFGAEVFVRQNDHPLGGS